MAEVQRKRSSNPQIVRQFWQAIPYIRAQKQVATFDRIVKYLTRVYQTPQETIDRELKLAKEDELVVTYTAVANKGAARGNTNEGFKVPEKGACEKDAHDWYCFACHKSGEVVECTTCWRVYHLDCIGEDVGDKFVCNVCQTMKQQPRMKRKELNRLLSYTLAHIKIKTKDLYMQEVQSIPEMTHEYLVFNKTEFSDIEEKINQRKYKYLDQFFADTRTVLHNIFICFGESSAMGELAKHMIRDCKYDLDEIRQCKDCYYYSNATPADWFCRPCNPPHDLVLAKQKGFSYWPAKVIAITKEGYDVRFFGHRHERAILPENQVKPIETDHKTLGIKKSPGFLRAHEELELYQSYMDSRTQDSHEEEEDDDNEGDADLSTLGLEDQPSRKRLSAARLEKEDEDEPPVKQRKSRSRGSKVKEEEVSSSAHETSLGSPSGSIEDVNLVTSSDMTHSQALTPEAESEPEKKLITDQLVASSTQTDEGFMSQSLLSQQSTEGPSDAVPVATVRPFTETTPCNCKEQYSAQIRKLQQEVEELKSKAAYSETKVRKELEKEKKSSAKALQQAQSQHSKEMDKLKRSGDEKGKDPEEVKKLMSKHKTELSAAKKKQWCYNCEEEAMYHCCWNTSYCSIKCQQEHWHREHKRMCRRKRNT